MEKLPQGPFHVIENVIERLYETDGETAADRYVQMTSFIRGEIEMARETGDTRDEWNALEESLADCDVLDSATLIEGFPDAVYVGMCLALLGGVPSEIQQFVNKLAPSAIQQRLPLLKRNARKQELMGSVRAHARQLWEEKDDQRLRITEMSELLWKEIVSSPQYPEFSDLLPDKPAGLKPWIRPVAPDYARRGGRPKKTLRP